MKPNWKKAILIATDILLAAYLVCAFTVFNKPDETARVCTKANIVVADESSNGFIDAEEVTRRLKACGLYPLGKQMQHINAREIQDRLKSSPFVKTAQCYKTEDGEVSISITQLMPVIRVKADNGDDYYLDDKDCIMPNSLYTSDLIIATGNIPRWYARRYISPLGKAIMANDMWKNLVVQINVLPNRDIEVVPRIGNHIVHLGQMPESNDKTTRQKLITEFVNRKLTRLEKFYKYGLSQAGWNKYSYIDIEFDNQIICKKRSEVARAEMAAAASAAHAPASIQQQIEQQQATMTTESRPNTGNDTPLQTQKALTAKERSSANGKPDSEKTEAEIKKEAKAKAKKEKPETQKAKTDATKGSNKKRNN